MRSEARVILGAPTGIELSHCLQSGVPRTQRSRPTPIRAASSRKVRSPDAEIYEFNTTALRDRFASQKKALLPQLLEFHAGIGDWHVIRCGKLCSTHSLMSLRELEGLRVARARLQSDHPRTAVKSDHKGLVLSCRGRFEIFDHIGIRNVGDRESFLNRETFSPARPRSLTQMKYPFALCRSMRQRTRESRTPTIEFPK